MRGAKHEYRNLKLGILLMFSNIATNKMTNITLNRKEHLWYLAKLIQCYE